MVTVLRGRDDEAYGMGDENPTKPFTGFPNSTLESTYELIQRETVHAVILCGSDPIVILNECSNEWMLPLFDLSEGHDLNTALTVGLQELFGMKIDENQIGVSTTFNIDDLRQIAHVVQVNFKGIYNPNGLRTTPLSYDSLVRLIDEFNAQNPKRFPMTMAPALELYFLSMGEQ